MRLKLKQWLAALGLTAFWTPSAYAADWVSGKVSVLSDYTAYSAWYGALVTLVDQSWVSGAGGGGPANCTQRFRIVIPDENVKNRLYSTLLSAKLSQQKVWLNVDTVAGQSGYCTIQIVAIGETSG